MSPYIFMASKFSLVLYTYSYKKKMYSYIGKKQRIISPRCDHYKVHYVPGVPENTEFNSVYFCASRREMDWDGNGMASLSF